LALSDAERAEPATVDAPATGDAGTLGTAPGGTLAAALALIAELPLTPAEKADAVRRLLAEP